MSSESEQKAPADETQNLPAPVEGLGSDDDAEFEQVLETARKQLESVVAAGRQKELFDVFERYLGSEITSSTFAELRYGVTLILGVEAFGLIASATNSEFDRVVRRIDTLQLEANERQLITDIAANFGTRLKIAFYASDVAPDAEEWNGTRRDIYLDVETGEHVIALHLRKRNGERAYFRLTPASLAKLTRSLLQVVLLVDDADAFPDTDRERLLERMDEVADMLAPSDQEQD